MPIPTWGRMTDPWARASCHKVTTSPMNKRLRKKKLLGEFREYGFRVWFQLARQLTTAEHNAVIDAFVHDAIEAHDLMFGGGGADQTWDGFVASALIRGSATEADRAAVVAWFASDPRIVGYRVYPLVDAWYGDSSAEIPGAIVGGAAPAA